jgi:hypothetical protein
MAVGHQMVKREGQQITISTGRQSLFKDDIAADEATHRLYASTSTNGPKHDNSLPFTLPGQRKLLTSPFPSLAIHYPSLV